ncbi:MAG: ElyC/SanA/YdcF family protein [Chthoniobacter sp.]|uniref:SanA/YdcF family protein n=1 Tax=Chthoniobacter sp. TaxID=2510640 RepID=UPI0032A65A8A
MASPFSFLRRRTFWLGLLLLAVLVPGFIAGANFWVLHSARRAIFTDSAQLPKNDVCLVLGTSRYNGDGISDNTFFLGRMNAAARLYHESKVRHLLVSGDNGHAGYDEPTWMRDALIQRGVPRDAITLDYAGFRTLDSMARAKAVFGLRRFTIVTDDFHMARSIFLARSYGLEVVGCPSEPVAYWWSKKVRTRELASRTVACLEVYLLHTKPRFYGAPVKIEVAATP